MKNFLPAEYNKITLRNYNVHICLKKNLYFFIPILHNHIYLSIIHTHA